MTLTLIWHKTGDCLRGDLNWRAPLIVGAHSGGLFLHSRCWGVSQLAIPPYQARCAIVIFSCSEVAILALQERDGGGKGCHVPFIPDQMQHPDSV